MGHFGSYEQSLELIKTLLDRVELLDPALSRTEFYISGLDAAEEAIQKALDKERAEYEKTVIEPAMIRERELTSEYSLDTPSGVSVDGPRTTITLTPRHYVELDRCYSPDGPGWYWAKLITEDGNLINSTSFYDEDGDTTPLLDKALDWAGRELLSVSSPN